MAKERTSIDKAIFSIEFLDEDIYNFNHMKKIIKRIYFIRYRYLGLSVAQSAEKVGVSRRTGYNWQKIWNESYINLFKVKNFGGPKPKLSDDNLNMLNELVTHNMSVKEVKNLIKDNFDVDFSEKHVRTSIMKRMKKLKNK